MAGTHLGAITTVGDDGAMTLMGRIVVVVSFAALVVLLTDLREAAMAGCRRAAQCRFADIASR